MGMNYKRGFLRAWVLVSAIWLAGVVWADEPFKPFLEYWDVRVFVSRIERGIEKIDAMIDTGNFVMADGSVTTINKLENDRAKFSAALVDAQKARRTHLAHMLVNGGALVAPPLALLILGLLLSWVARGFRGH